MPDEAPRATPSLAERLASRIASDRASLQAAAAPPEPAPLPVPSGPTLPPLSAPPPTPEATAQTAPVQEHSASFQINFKRLEAAGVAAPTAQRGSRIEELRLIKRQLLKMTFAEGRTRTNDNSNVIMVTSAVPGEGKTFLSLNLALSFSMEQNLHVLLVDADHHRRTLSGLVGAPESAVGLIDLMTDRRLKMRDIILRTNLANLAFIPSGQPHPQGAELLASQEMAAVMRELAQRYPDRVILIDTPPLLASSEGAALSANVGQIVLVIEKNRTTKGNLRRSIERIDSCDTISLILNKDTGPEIFSGYSNEYESS